MAIYVLFVTFIYVFIVFIGEGVLCGTVNVFCLVARDFLLSVIVARDVLV